MKILQIVPELNFGGVEIGTVDMAKQLLLLGHQPIIMSSGGKLVDTLRKMGIVHYTLPVQKKSLRLFQTARDVAEIIRKDKIDIVHARSRIPALIAYLATRRTSACFITSCHGYYSHHLLSHVMGWGERVIVISHSIGRRMIDTFQVPPERVRLVHRGLDIHKYPFDTARFQMGQKRQKDKFIVANIARITPLKGHKTFLQAVRFAKRTFPTMEVWLIGSAGKKKKYFEEILSLIDKFGLQDSVKLFGARSDIPDLLKQVDLLVLSTSVPEGFGRVLIEAGASGVPVIATRVGGVLDVIDHGKDGILVPPGEPLAMSNAIQKVFSEYEHYEQVAKTFRAKIEEHFTLEVMAKKTVAIYEEALRKKNILVIKLGALGDLILIIPSLRALRKKYQQAHIALVVDTALAPLIEQCPYIDEVITFQRKGPRFLSQFFRVIKALRKDCFTLSIDFQNSKWTHMLAFFADIKRRYGYARGYCGRLLSQGIRMDKSTIAPVKHQLRILNLLGITEMTDTLELWTRKEDGEAVNKMLGEEWIKPEQILVGFVLNASREWSTKRWPLQYYVDLAERLKRELNVCVVLIGDASSKVYAEEFLLKTDTDAVNLAGKTTLRQMVALIERMSCLVTGDTAPLRE